MFEFNVKTPTASPAVNSQPSISKKSTHNNTKKRKSNTEVKTKVEEGPETEEHSQSDVEVPPMSVDESYVLEDPVTKEEALDLIKEIYRRSNK